MDIHKALEELTTLGLPKNTYVIVSSGALAIRGIREAHDLDILVTEDLWQELKGKYKLTKTHPVENIDLGDLQILGHGSIYRDSPELTTAEDLITTAEIIDGHPFARLDLIYKIKQKEGRTKDLNDLKLIEAYQNSHIT